MLGLEWFVSAYSDKVSQQIVSEIENGERDARSTQTA